jgi:hypothetical protein
MTSAILRAASWLAPAAERAEWLAEWRSELFYVRRMRSPLSALAFVLGALPDAFWLRRNTPAATPRRAFVPASPVHCILLLAALATITGIGAERLTSVRVAPGLVAITAAGRRSSVSYDAYRSIVRHTWRPFSGLAFFQPVRAHVQFGPGRPADLEVALATPSLAELLNVPSSRGEGPAVILSDRVWRLWFARDPSAAGRLIEIDGQTARIAGVMPLGAWPLPVAIDAWLLDPEQPPDDARGFVLAKAKTPPEPGRRWSIAAPNHRGGWDQFECAPLDLEPSVRARIGVIFLSLLLLPLLTSLQLGDYPATAHSPRGATRLFRWCFLGLKLVFLAPSIYWATLIVGALIAPGLQAHGLFVGYLLGFRWALVDQRRRCPVCLRLLTNPTPIGCSSRIFLEWYGTELICAKGHGLLHVPGIQTSSYSSQRWLYLDPSWTSLFS